MGNSNNRTDNSPVPGGSLAKPVMIALGALLIGRMLKGNHDEAPPSVDNGSPQADSGGGLLGSVLGGLGGLLGGAAASAPSASGPLGGGSLGGGLSGGLGGLLDQLKQAGLGDKVDSWLGDGENHAIEPAQVGDAIGQTTLSELAEHAGIDQQELLNQLSQVLPGLVDKLTAGGKVPDVSELSKLLQSR